MFDECDDLLISVIVPAYNIESYVEKCIRSIIGQTYKNIEIILVDDGSTDKSAEICDKFARQDERIRVIHKKNGGLVSARKAGINIATGEYVLYVDGDDWIEKDRICNVVVQILKHKSDMIYLSGYKYDVGAKSVSKDDLIEPRIYLGSEIEEDLFPLVQDTEKCFECRVRGSLCLWCIRRSLLKEKQNLVDDRISMCEDQICVWFCLLSANSVSVIVESGYHYIQRGDSLSYMKDAEESKKLQIWYRQLKEYIEEHTDSAEVKKRFVFLTVRVLLLSDYEMLFLDDNSYLFPYPKVTKKSRIIVYGAGKLGHQLVRALDKRDWELVLWVDQNTERNVLPGYRISPVTDILEAEYDFIVIAAVYEKLSLEMKESLLSMGIEERKIAMMDSSVITEEHLNKVYKGGGDSL